MQEQEFHLDKPFELESGLAFPELRISYHTYGKLNAQKDNVIWVCHALTASSAVHDWWAGLFGAGNVFDPEKYFIVCANNIGSPYGSISPDHVHPQTGERYGMSFPEFTLKDTAFAILELMKQLKIENIQHLIGGSCGGNIAMEMAILLGLRIKNLSLLCCAARETPWTIAIHQSQRIALESDPDFYQNKSRTATKGLKSARAFALPFYRTSGSINMRQKEEDLHKMSGFKSASYISYQGEKFINRFDAHCYYKLLNALDTHNLGRGHESIPHALKKIKSNTLVFGIDSDLFIPIEEQQFLADHIPNARYLEIKSIFGHDAFLIEITQIRDHLLSRKSKPIKDL